MLHVKSNFYQTVSSLTSGITGTNPLPIPTTVEGRLAVVKDVVNRLYAQAVPHHQTDISVKIVTNGFEAPFSFSSLGATCSLGTSAHTLLLSPIWLINPEEIPQKFRFSDINDPRLADQELIKQYAAWISAQTGIPTLENPPDPAEFQLNLLFFANQKMAKQAIKFTLMHELGHIHHNDARNIAIARTLSLFISLSWPICVAIALTCPIILAVPFVITASCVSYKVLTYLRSIYAKKLEFKADAFAAQYSPDSVEGGIYFLNACTEGNLFNMLNSLSSDSLNKLRQCGLERLRSSISHTPTNDHPSDADRIAALEVLGEKPSSAIDPNHRWPKLVPAFQE